MGQGQRPLQTNYLRLFPNSLFLFYEIQKFGWNSILILYEMETGLSKECEVLELPVFQSKCDSRTSFYHALGYCQFQCSPWTNISWTTIRHECFIPSGSSQPAGVGACPTPPALGRKSALQSAECSRSDPAEVTLWGQPAACELLHRGCGLSCSPAPREDARGWTELSSLGLHLGLEQLLLPWGSPSQTPCTMGGTVWGKLPRNYWETPKAGI